MNAANYKQVEKDFSEWLYRNERGDVWFCPPLKAWSKLGESEAGFRSRLLHQAHETRDAAVEKIRDATARKLRTLEGRLQTAEGQLAKNKASATAAKMQAGASILTGILGTLMGRKSGVGTITRGSTAIGRASTAYNRSQSVSTSEARVESLRDEIRAIEEEAQQEIARISASFSPQSLPLEPETLSPTRTNVRVERVALLWLPHTTAGQPAW
jgi:hypothetical protein